MIRDLIYYGNPGLRKKCVKVTEITDEVRQIVQDLIDTVLEKNGAAIAAPQIGCFVRIFVTRYGAGIEEDGDPVICPPKVYINPKISNPSKEMITHHEGCLSIPDVKESVVRPYEIDVEAMDLEGNVFTERAYDWHARAIMHENDHLNGVLFIDRVSPSHRKKMEPALKEIKKKYNS